MPDRNFRVANGQEIPQTVDDRLENRRISDGRIEQMGEPTRTQQMEPLTGIAPAPTGPTSLVDYSQKIPNNVDLSTDRRLQRALESWHPKFMDWWEQLG